MTRYEGSFKAIPGWDDPDVSDRLFEKGALLYQEYEWRWVRILGWCALAVVSLGTAAMFAYLALTDAGLVERALFLVLSGMFVLLAGLLVVLSIKMMPFRVYEGGVTLSMVPTRDGLAGREVFVPSWEIESVTYVVKSGARGGVIEYFDFHRLGGEDFHVSVRFPEEVTPYLFQVLRCPVEGPG